MRRALKVVGYVAAGVIALILVAAAAVYGFSEARYRRHYAVTPRAISVPTDSASIARGAHVAQTFGGCVECHGENLAGKVVFDDPPVGRVYGKNLTRGKGGVGAELTDADIVRAMEHGVARDGRPLKVMPSTDYTHLSDADVAAIVAWVRSRPPIDTAQPPVQVGPVGRALFVAGKLPMLHAERIDHARPMGMTVTPGVTVEYGRYIAAVGCQGCHGQTLAGGPIEGGAPDWPPAANLTPAGSLKTWTADGFTRFLRTGVRPNGAPVSPVMPIRETSRLTDDEIRALWLYLQTIPAAPRGVQTAAR
ncbi:MAG: c-type cytochrome [Gemmatimonadaceae bacterium]|nr:c-type cytochrome [Gemmatimonadaceae bacterium]NUO95581.1 c-type cytochrome [Gemmatimonadaceae bacterium]NUP55679.1 c-type cytochrome [Gemmatimonadaceae bacterium]NUP71372.1 c-type cytochrome [Gemmatimonadaceae bacterium]NUR32696.1 c-type cytochrome [Gemmatimonadaceae bacterium]